MNDFIYVTIYLLYIQCSANPNINIFIYLRIAYLIYQSTQQSRIISDFLNKYLFANKKKRQNGIIGINELNMYERIVIIY